MRTTATCERVRAELVHYVYGERPPGGWAEVEQHLATCSACAGEHARIRQTWDRQGLWEDVDVPAGAFAPVQAAIEAAAGRGPARGWLRGVADGLLAALVLWAIGRLVPLSVICATCHSLLKLTPLGQWQLLDEFFAGLLLALPSLLVAYVIRRLRGAPDAPGRGWAMGLTYGVSAGIGGPLVRFIVAPWENLLAWALGCLIGGTLWGAIGRLRPAGGRA